MHWSDLAGRRDADQKTATGREKLLGDEDGKCGPYRTPYNAVVVPVVAKRVQLCVVAGPSLMLAGAFGGT